jgi:hypothetical protein
MERFGKRNEVNRLLAFAEGDHLIENAAMLFEKEVFGLEVFDSGVKSVIVEQNGAKDGAFGVEVLRERTFESRGGGHLGNDYLIRFFFAFLISRTFATRKHGSCKTKNLLGWRAIRTLGAL